MGGKKNPAKEEAAKKKEEQKKAEAKAAEDAKWEDPELKKKQQKKAKEEEKKKEKLAKEQEKKEQQAQEIEEVKNSKKNKRRNKADKTADKLQAKQSERELENAVMELQESGATGMDAAIDLLSSTSGQKKKELDRHPEKRAKAAFKAFEARRLPELQAENPGLRRSQLKELLAKEWKKSPENPLNQEHLAYNEKPSSEE